MDHFVGVDLGKFVDPTALCVLCRSLAIDKQSGLPSRGARGEPLYTWEARALKRYALGTAYTSIVADVVRIVQRPELQPYPRLVIDSTGCGAPVAEMFSAALRNIPSVEMHTVSITSGESFSNVTNLTRVNLVARGVWRVSKSQLIGSIRVVLEQRRFKVSPDPDTGKPIEHAAVLIRELQAFREKLTEAGNTTWEARQGAHDDLILSACLPIFIGSQPWCHMNTMGGLDNSGMRFKPRETTAIDAEQAAVELAEAEAMKREQEFNEEQQKIDRKRRNRAPWEAEPTQADREAIANCSNPDFWE
jgi:hypothetical protein